MVGGGWVSGGPGGVGDDWSVVGVGCWLDLGAEWMYVVGGWWVLWGALWVM